MFVWHPVFYTIHHQRKGSWPPFPTRRGTCGCLEGGMGGYGVGIMATDLARAVGT